MSTFNTQQKPWFARTCDLFVNLHTEPSIERAYFLTETITLTQQIQELAIRKFDGDQEKVQKLAEIAFDVVLGVPNDQKIDVLVRSELFRLIVSTTEPSKKIKDHEYYKSDIVMRQLQGYSNMKKVDISYITQDQDALNWICEANETLQTPQERHDMRVSMRKIPIDYYNQTQQKRMEIGKLITSKVICQEVQSLLKEEQFLFSSEAQEIYKQYCESLIKPVPLKSQAAVIKNLIVSLEIRSRQLP